MPTIADLGGVVIPEDMGDATFYGFRLNPVNGQLTIEVINNGDGTIQLPFDYILNVNDYRQWLWSKRALNFVSGAKGHILMQTL